MEDVGEQDDDEGEDDAEEVAAPARRRPKRDGDGKPKVRTYVSHLYPPPKTTYNLQSTFGIPILPPPLPQQHPISSDRLRPPQNKKPRVGSSSAGGPQRTSRSSSEDTGYGYHPAPSFPYPQQHHSHHPPPQHQYQYAPQHQHSYPAQYPPFFQPPPSSHAHNDSPTTPQFIPLQSDFTFPPPRAHSPDRGGYGPRSIPSHRSNFTNGNGNGNGNSSSTGGSAGAGAGAGDLFAAFLDADEQRRRRSVPISPASAPGDSTRLGLDWPVHSAAAPAGAPPAAAVVSAERETAPGPGWLEFLSGSGDGRGAPGQGTGSGSGREAGGGGDGDGAKVESREVEIRASGESV